ncbi:MAG: hypothetical protein JRJ12_14825 [Deltaproteobacteria bacterium]|nr:hypothetical protein [Deltaproteobacteria bacterium]
MTRIKLLLIVAAWLTVSFLASQTVQAGWMTANQLQLLIHNDNFGQMSSENVTPDSADASGSDSCALPVNGRKGYWFDSAPWIGVAVDAASSETENVTSITREIVEGSATPVDGFVMLRYPSGRLQPYMSLGPSFSFSEQGINKLDLLGHMVVGVLLSF